MKYLSSILFVTILLTGCQSNESTEPEQSQEVENSTPVEKKQLEHKTFVECTGFVDVPPDSRLSIHTPISGMVASIDVLEGEHVRKGQKLATLEHMSIIEIQENYMTAKAEYDFAKKEYERKSNLLEKSAISEKEYDRSKQKYETARASHVSLSAQIEFLGIPVKKLNIGEIQHSITITAPKSGYITDVYAHKGSFAEQNMELFRIVDDSHKHIHLKVYAEDANRIREGQKIEFRSADSDSTYIAEVYLIGKNIDEGQNTVSVHGHLKDESKALLVGTYVLAKVYVE